MRIVVLLPAPFGPRKPTISPRATSNETSSMAVKAPNRLVSRSAEIMARSASIGGERPHPVAVRHPSRAAERAQTATLVEAFFGTPAPLTMAPCQSLDGDAPPLRSL